MRELERGYESTTNSPGKYNLQGTEASCHEEDAGRQPISHQRTIVWVVWLAVLDVVDVEANC